MIETPTDRSPWLEGPRMEGWPRTFAEVGLAMQRGADWEGAWSGWNHALMFRKDPRCLAEEPPAWFRPARRAMMAGAADFLAKLYGISPPGWTSKAEYFLAKPDYSNCAICFGEDDCALLHSGH